MSRLVWVAFAAVVVTSSIHAAPVCAVAPFSTYLAGGFECEINAAVFGNFGFFSQDSTTTTALSPNDITVSPLQVGSQVGLRFAGDFVSTGLPDGPGPAEGLAAVQYRFFFEVTRPGSLFTDATVILNDPTRFSPNPLKFGGVLSAKSISNDGATAITDDQDPDLMDTGALFTPRTTITIDELLQLTGGASAAGTLAPVGVVTLDSADNLFAFDVQIPEPGTWLLCISGGALVLLRLKSRWRV